MMTYTNPKKVNPPMADCPLRGKQSNTCLATVISGKFLNETVGVMVQYLDGWCICDMGSEEPMEIIHINDLRLWVSVDSVQVI